MNARLRKIFRPRRLRARPLTTGYRPCRRRNAKETGLPIVIPPVHLRHTYDNLGGAIIHYFAVVTKINKRTVRQVRVLVISNNDIYMCDADRNNVNRCVAIGDVERIIYNYQTVGLIVRSEHDLLFECENFREAEVVVNMIRDTFRHLRGEHLTTSNDIIQQQTMNTILHLGKRDSHWHVQVRPLDVLEVPDGAPEEEEVESPQEVDRPSRDAEAELQRFRDHIRVLEGKLEDSQRGMFAERDQTSALAEVNKRLTRELAEVRQQLVAALRRPVVMETDTQATVETEELGAQWRPLVPPREVSVQWTALAGEFEELRTRLRKSEERVEFLEGRMEAYNKSGAPSPEELVRLREQATAQGIRLKHMDAECERLRAHVRSQQSQTKGAQRDCEELEEVISQLVSQMRGTLCETCRRRTETRVRVGGGYMGTSEFPQRYSLASPRASRRGDSSSDEEEEDVEQETLDTAVPTVVRRFPLVRRERDSTELSERGSWRASMPAAE